MYGLTIPQLQLGYEIQTIRLRITRIWDCIQNISRHRFGIAFIGVDYRGNGVHVQIFETHVGLFRGRLTEGNVYQFPEVAVYTNQIIFFHADTISHQVIETPGIYDRYFFDFSGEDTLEEEAKWDTYLADVIGIIRTVKATTHILLPAGLTVGKKEIEFMTLKGRRLSISIWEPLYNNLDIPVIIASRPRPSVILTGLRVRSFPGGATLSSTSASTAHINLDIPETARVQRMYARMEEANGST